MLRRLALVTLALALPALAAAQYDPRYPRQRPWGPPLVGPTISGWVGFAAPTGSFDGFGASRLSDVINHAVPFGVELAYRFSPLFRAGLYFEGAPLSIDSRACDPGDPCNGSTFQFGLDTQLHFASYHSVDPWIGIGVGYEWLRVAATAGPVGAGFPETWHYDGWIFPRLSAGLDFMVSPTFTLGPYVSYSAGQFSSVHTASDGVTSTIFQQAYHGWFGLGLRGNFNL